MSKYHTTKICLIRTPSDTGAALHGLSPSTCRKHRPAKPLLRLAICGIGARQLTVGMNDQTAGMVTNLVYNATINRDGIEGSWSERDVTFDASLMKTGKNVLKLTIPAGGLTSGIMYDYLRLELNPTPVLSEALSKSRMTKRCLVIFLSCAGLNNIAVSRTMEPFDSDWSFSNANVSGADQSQFDDRAWQKINVPHDWSIAGPFAETNLTGGAGGFLPSGIGWYRKHFSLPPDASNQCVSVEFDGVMANSDVWINGFHLGKRPYGYVSFSYDLTGQLNFNADNVLAVRTDTSQQPASRWYAGAGIYRHVRLVEKSPVHIPQWQTFVWTPQVNETQAIVHVQSTVTNESNTLRQISLNISILDSNGRTIAREQTPAQTISNLSSAQFNQDIVIKNPQLWSCEQPDIYQARVEVCTPLFPIQILNKQ